MNKFLFILLIISIGASTHAQNRYVIHFKDKVGTPFTITNPEAFLSERAITRRLNQGIVITEEDLPVNPTYISQVKALDIDVFYASKWFNAILVQMQASQRASVLSLPFVDEVELVAPGTRLKRGSRMGRTEDSEEVELVANQFQNEILGVNVLHEEGFLGKGLIIAVLDGGFPGVNSQPAFEHLFTDNKVVDQFNFVENDQEIFQYGDHGTRAFSAMGADLIDEYRGVAPNSDYLLYITEEERNANGSFTEYRIEEYNLLFGLERADSSGVDIVSASVGYYTFDDSNMDYAYEDMDGATTVVTRACEKAFEKGIFVVTSAGNQGNRSWNYVTAPADGPNVMAVGAVDEDLQREAFSSFGPNFNGQIKPDVMALGVGTSLIDKDGADFSSGTSFAAPQVAGLAALLWQREPELTNRQLFDLILSLGSQSSNPDNEMGYGIPNAAKLITSLNNINESGIGIYPNPFDHFLIVEKSNNVKRVELYDIQGIRQNISFNDSGENIELSTPDLSPGLYLLSIHNYDGSIVNIKLIKTAE